MKFIQDFKAFAMRGNVVDMAFGIIIGASFSTITNSLVDDILMPCLGLFTNGINYTDIFLTLKHGAPAGPYPTLASAKAAGATTINLGMFLSSVLSFLLVSLALFLLLKAVNKVYKSPVIIPRQELLLAEIRDALLKQNAEGAKPTKKKKAA